MTDTLREKIARIVDGAAFRAPGDLATVLGWIGSENAIAEAEASYGRRRTEALAKADSILNLIRGK